MTFSLRSSFSSANHRVLLVAADKALLYICERGRLARSYAFPAGDAGLAAFARYLDGAPATPTHLLVDIVEEEYRSDTVPHVYGRDRRAVLTRKFARLFRGTHYCLAIRQGREPEGRRDDRVLLTALTKPEIITPWIAELAQHKVPLAGIYSLPILSEKLLARIGAQGQNILLISVQHASGLRQTFFRDGQLRISRLAQMPRIGSVPYASHLVAELDKLRRYLNSLALISRDSPLAVYILSHGALLAELEQHCRDSDAEQYFLVDIAELARELRIPGDMATPHSDALFAQLLLEAAPRESYAQPEETRYFRLYQTRVALLVASVLLLLASTAWSTFNFVDAISLKQQALDAAQKADFYRERFELARQDLPRTPVEPEDIKTAVDIVATLAVHKSSPVPLMAGIGARLAEAPEIKLDTLEWYASTDPGRNERDRAAPAAPAEAPQILPDPRYSHYEIAILHGHVAPFDGDYRAAIARIDALAGAFGTAAQMHAVQVLAYPLDTRPAASMTGAAAKAGDTLEARFTLKLVLGVASAAREG